jgi:hypothetical protein
MAENPYKEDEMRKTTKKLNKKDEWLLEAKQLQGFEKDYNQFIKEQKKSKVERQEKELNEKVDNFLSNVVDDGTKPSGPADINSYYSARPDLCWDPNSVYVPYVDPVIDLNDFNTQATVQVAADGGLKDDLNDIKNLLKAMNENLDKILHHLNGGWN